MSEDASAYRLLAQRLDALPNGFPPAPDGSELRLLAKLYTPEEAALAATLRLTPESAAEIAVRTGGDPATLAAQLKGMARRGLIKVARTPGGLVFALMPFVVGIFEAQGNTIDAELARLFEDYYQAAFGRAMAKEPAVHRVIPVQQSIQVDMEIRPYESAAELIAANKAWGVLDCICRKEKALIGEPCGHPIDVCMALAPVEGLFDHVPFIRALTQDGALDTLHRASEAGLVHSVGNSQEGITYICNCCTCGCAILRSMSELGMANVMARSAFVNQVDETLCSTCGACIEQCQFAALSLADTAQVDAVRCVGCGVCVLACPEDALALVRRPEAEVLPPPANEREWMAARAATRGLDIAIVL
jgi:Na+-translocating ferredoxin:NAD+ oxidoreductase subunit B